jgi:serine/threonine protein kinase
MSKGWCKMSGIQETQSKTRSQNTLIGRSLQQGTYQVEAVIGHGGMGEVFLASHRALDVPVALKQGRADQPLPESVITELDNLLHQQQVTPRTPASHAFSDDFPLTGGINTDRFLREALLLARLSHPAIPTLYDYFFEDGYWYLVMEYLPGPTLAVYMRQYAPLPPLEALNYTMQLCDVLDYLHQQALPVVFRDLKPSNVILSPEGRLMLVDFGIARYFKEGQINDTTDFGSPGYASPEQYEGNGQTDGRSDLYSLGVMLHEMISGQRPIRTGTRANKLESPRQINPALSPALSGLVIVATRAESMYRFQTAHTFYTALERTCTIEERRAFNRFALLIGEDERAAQPHTRIQPSIAQNRAIVPASDSKSQAVAPGRQHTRARENLHKVRRERLEQDALAMQLASIDESLKQRAASLIMPTPLADEREFAKPRSKTLRRVLRFSLILLFLLAGILTSLFAYQHYAHHNHTPPVTSSQRHTVTPPPEVTTQITWQVLPSLPSPEADNTESFVVTQGKSYIYVSGGFRGAGSTPLYSRGLYRYDIEAAHWEGIVNKEFPIMGNNAAAVDENNSIFFTGGFSTDTGKVTQALYMYSPDKGSLQKIIPPAQAVIGFGSAILADQAGHLYLTEGFTTPGYPKAQAGTGWYRYDINTATWEILTPLPTGSGYVTLAPDGQGGIILIGGSKDAGQRLPTSNIYRYDTIQNVWTLEPISAPMAVSGAASCLDGQGHLVILGGYDPAHTNALDTAWLVTLKTLKWTALPTLPGGGSLLGAAACDGAGHVFLERGANNTGHPTADFLELTLQS